jgi:hypothetical protein
VQTTRWITEKYRALHLLFHKHYSVQEKFESINLNYGSKLQLNTMVFCRSLNL